jgi:hypothetical protein
MQQKFIRLLLVGTIIFFNQWIHAQFPIDAPYQSNLSTTPALPDYLESIIDNSVPSDITIKRITQYIPEWDWYPHHEYAKAQPWNADASVYKFYTVALYDAISHQMIKDLPGSPLYPTYWSNIDANILYGFKENGDIKTYSLDTEQIDLLSHIYFDETNAIDYDIVKLGPGEGNIDKNDHYVAFVGKRGLDMYVIVYDLQLHQVKHTKLFAGAWGNGTEVPDYVDWVSVSQSGDYVGIMWNHNTTSEENPFNTHYGVEIYNSIDMQYLRRISSYGNHGDFGFAQNGDEVFVQFWGPTGSLNMYFLDRLERVVLSSNSDFSGEGHISCRNLNRPGWAYVSQDEEVHTGQIVAIKLDDSGIVEHFGHHYSTASTYDKSPMPCPNPNGDKIMYKSDFGDATTEIIYCFEAKSYDTASITETNTDIVQAYPNPTSSFINLQSKNTITAVFIYNTIGDLKKTIYPNNSKSLYIDLTSFKKGIYLLKTVAKDTSITHKILKE